MIFLENFSAKLAINIRVYLYSLPCQIRTVIWHCVHPFILIHSLKVYTFSFLKKRSVKHIFITGFPKSRTTWIENLALNIPGYIPFIPGGDYKELRSHNLSGNSLNCLPRNVSVGIKSHLRGNRKNITILLNAGIDKIVVLIRDPRDVIVSNYFYARKNNPWQRGEKAFSEYKNLTKKQGLDHSVKFMKDSYKKWIEEWINVKNNKLINVHFVKYEDFLINPQLEFTKIIEFYQLELETKEIPDILERIQKKSNKKSLFNLAVPGKNNTKRKGVAGSWRDELDKEQISLINKSLLKTIRSLGYPEK